MNIMQMMMGASGVVVPGIDADTALMMHMDGANDGVTFSDSSITNNKGNATVGGNVVTKTATKKWGTASAQSIDTDRGEDLHYAYDADWNIYADDTVYYNIDFWVKCLDHVGGEVFLYQRDTVVGNHHWFLRHVHGTGLQFFIKDTAVTKVDISGGEIEDTDWHHILVAKVVSAGPTVEWGLYKDGTQVAYVSQAFEGSNNGGLYLFNSSGDFSVFSGNMDELRIQKSNLFGAAPNVGLTDTIDVPTKAYSA